MSTCEAEGNSVWKWGTFIVVWARAHDIEKTLEALHPISLQQCLFFYSISPASFSHGAWFVNPYMHTKYLIHHFIQFKHPTPQYFSNRVSNPKVHFFFLSWSIFLLVLCVFSGTLNAHVGKQKLCIFQFSTVVLLSHCCTTIKIMWTQPDTEAWSRFNIIQLSSVQFYL